MRFIKLGIISIIFFAIFLTLISFLFPGHVRISKALEIKTERDTLIRYLTDNSCLAKWNSIEPGTQRVASILDSSEISLNSSDRRSGFTILPAHIPNALTVQYYLDFHLRWYPWEKFSSLLLEKKYGRVMEKDLDRLRLLLEEK